MIQKNINDMAENRNQHPKRHNFKWDTTRSNLALLGSLIVTALLSKVSDVKGKKNLLPVWYLDTFSLEKVHGIRNINFIVHLFILR